MKTFTRKRVNICFDFQRLVQENEEKTPAATLTNKHFTLDCDEKQRKGEETKKKKKTTFQLHIFLSLTLSISAARQLGGERVSQTIRPAGTVNTLRVSKRSCVLSV